MNDSIFVYKDYGNIKFDIKSIMDRKNISVNQIVKKTGLHHQVIRRYYDGTIVRKNNFCHYEIKIIRSFLLIIFYIINFSL